MKSELESQIAVPGLNDTVRRLDDLPYARVLEALSNADLLALACVDARSEGEHMDGIPVALMEAMAMGLPVVTTGVSGVPELVSDGTSGRSVPGRDVTALASAIEALATDAAARVP